MKPVLLVLYPGCAYTEIAPVVAMLAERPKRFLGPSLDPVTTAEGLRVLPDCTYAQADPAGAAAVVIPGGSPDTVMEDAALHALLRACVGGPVVAAICNGALVLAAAGVLAGRRVTHTCTPDYAPLPAFEALLRVATAVFASSVFVDEDVVDDGAVITAKPWAAIAFAHTLARRLGVPREEAARSARYLRGQRDGAEPDLRWAVFLTTPAGVTTTGEHVGAHVRWLRGLENRGLLERGGPFPDHAAGLVVLRVRSREEAGALAETDPFVTAGVRTFEVRRWFLSCVENDHLGRLS